MSLILYTKNQCVFCDIMKENLNRWGVKYMTVNVQEDPEALELLKERGIRTVPQLFLNGVSLNQGIDTREFTEKMLYDKIMLYINDNRSDWESIPIEIREWAEQH